MECRREGKERKEQGEEFVYCDIITRNLKTDKMKYGTHFFIRKRR